ncbi:MAG: transglycosylase domain-containing protein [Bacteroidota bacterium]
MEKIRPNSIERIWAAIRTIVSRAGFFRLAIRLVAMLVAAITILSFVLVMLVWAGVFGALPGKEELKSIQHAVASEVYSADSVLLGRYYLQDRSTAKPEEIPQHLKDALIATEDARFYKHKGIDIRSMVRVLTKSILLQRESGGGGSTLTQQLAKNLYGRKSYALLSLPINKIREFFIAWRLEHVYTKNEILLLYLNTIPFSENTFGIKTAAGRFFSSSVSSLTPDQSAVLVGMLKATHSYNPRLFPHRAKNRRNVVFAQMEKYNFISSAENDSLQNLPLVLHYNKLTHNTGLAPYFREHIKRELLTWCSTHRKQNGEPYNLYTDGLRIYTTIDARLQQYAEEAMEAHMKELQKRFAGQLNRAKLDALTTEKLRELDAYKALGVQGLSEAEIITELKKPVATRIFTWEGEKEAAMSRYDSVKHHLQFLQAGVLASDPASGAIKVWVGGINHEYFQFDHVRESTKRQVGSTIKPLLYAAALESGIGPCSYISARKTEYSNMKDWSPENTDDETYEKKYSMEGGLAGSVNTVSVKLLEKTGISNAIQVARKMGISSNLPAVPSLALGTPSISMMEMVGAYGVFARSGKYAEPTMITSITSHDGEVLELLKKASEPQQAVSEETASIMIHMLKRVVQQGTGARLKTRYGITNDVAGKTGTTQSNVDGWFIAVTPKLVVGAWVGADDPRMHFSSTALGQGASTALPIVAKLFQQANRDRNLNDITQAKFAPLPDDLEKKLDCDLSKSNRNFFDRLFNLKRGTKVTKFKKKRGRDWR